MEATYKELDQIGVLDDYLDWKYGDQVDCKEDTVSHLPWPVRCVADVRLLGLDPIEEYPPEYYLPKITASFSVSEAREFGLLIKPLRQETSP